MANVDSYEVIKRPRIPCYGCCGRELRESVVVLEYKPTSTLLFFCPSCASNRMVLDDVALQLSHTMGCLAPIDIVEQASDAAIPNVDRKVAQWIRINTYVPSHAAAIYGNYDELRDLALINEGYRFGYAVSTKRWNVDKNE